MNSEINQVTKFLNQTVPQALHILIYASNDGLIKVSKTFSPNVEELWSLKYEFEGK